jgi:hypothetical protein
MPGCFDGECGRGLSGVTLRSCLRRYGGFMEPRLRTTALQPDIAREPVSVLTRKSNMVRPKKVTVTGKGLRPPGGDLKEP